MAKPFPCKSLSGPLAALLLAVAVCLAAAAPAPAAQAPEKQVLLLLSGHCCLPWYEISAAAVREVFRQADGRHHITLHTEYTSLDSNFNPSYLQKLRELYQQKYGGLKLDLIIAVADLSVDFVLKYRQALFPDVPVVFVAEPSIFPRVANRPNLTGVIGTAKIKENLELILRLHPDIENLAVVSGAASYDRFYENQARKVFKEYASRLNFIYLTGLPTGELLAKLGQLPPHTVMFYILTTEDGAGSVLVPREVLPRITGAFHGPAYGMWDTLLGYGITGGLLSSAELAGAEAARLGLRILAGEKPADIPYVKGAYAYMFDWRQLEKWGMAESALPPGSIIRYQELSPWDMYKWWLVLGAALLVLAVTGYIKNRTRRYKGKLAEQERVRRMLQRQVAERTAGLQQANAELARLSNIDGLTGLYNRRYFDAMLEREWRRHQRSASPLSLIMGDLDFFKAYNDTYGHQAGDGCLQAVAQAMRERIKRPADIAARYGGEEFALILTNTASAGARQVAQDIQAAIHGLAITHAASPLGMVTMSFGVATLVPGPNHQPEALVQMADGALYRAKDLGRDRIEALDGL